MKCVRIHSLAVLVSSFILISFFENSFKKEHYFSMLENKTLFSITKVWFFQMLHIKRYIHLCGGYFEICIHIQGKIF